MSELPDRECDAPASITIRGCDRDEAFRALKVLWGYLDNPDYPQHKYIGRRTGGGARIGDTYFWVWQTTSGWCVERVLRKRAARVGAETGTQGGGG